MSTITVGPTFTFNTDTLKLSQLLQGTPTVATSSQLSIEANGLLYSFIGSGVTYDSAGRPASGTINELKVTTDGGALAYDITQIGVSAKSFADTLVRDGASPSIAPGFNDYDVLNALIGSDITFIGGPMADTFKTEFGSNPTATVKGGPGDDTLSVGGGTGTFTLVLTGNFADYTISFSPDLRYTVHDNRPSSPDGTDTVNGFTAISFADRTTPFLSTDGFTLFFDMVNVLRTNPITDRSVPVVGSANNTFFASNLSMINLASETPAQAAAKVALLADGTTAVATMAYQFFTGATPTPAGLDYLVSPTGANPNNLNSAYYSQFSTTNRYINFASNLGKAGAGAAAFQAVYGNLSLTDATTKAYAAIFGSTPTADKVSHLLNDLVPNGAAGTYARENYFALYGGDGLNGTGTKAAMVGWLIAQADSAHIGTLETANAAYLLDLAAGRITAAVDLIGTYHGTAYTGG